MLVSVSLFWRVTVQDVTAHDVAVHDVTAHYVAVHDVVVHYVKVGGAISQKIENRDDCWR